MATFNLTKAANDTAEPELMEEGWYKMRLSKDPKEEDNSAKRTNPADPKAGTNLVLRMTSMSDVPEFNGRMFTVWLPIPKPGDSDQYTQGQTVEDAKIDRIAAHVDAFTGDTLEGDTFDLSQGMMAYFEVIKTLDRNGTKMVNDIRPFSIPKSIEQYEAEQEDVLADY